MGLISEGSGAKKVIRMGMCFDFHWFTQIQSVDGFTVLVFGLLALRLA